MRFVAYGEGGWGDLFEVLAPAALRSVSLKPSSKLDVIAHVQAYRKAGLDDRALSDALHSFMRITSPRVVTEAEFAGAVEECAACLLQHVSQPARHFAFLISGGVKSNLWIFLRLMHALRGSLDAVAWKSVRQRIWLYAPDVQPQEVAHSSKKRDVFARPLTLVITDDCAYSGAQLSYLTNIVLHETPLDRLILCPIYATPQAVRRLTSLVIEGPNTALGKPAVGVTVPRIVGYTPKTSTELAEADVALCIRPADARADAPWTVVSLLEVLGIVKYDAQKCPCAQTCYCSANIRERDAWFTGSTLLVDARCVGTAAVVFEHKVADLVSIPTNWLLLGCTLRRLLTSMSLVQTMGSKVHVGVVPLRTLLLALDFDPEASDAQQGRRWAFSDLFSSNEFNQVRTIFLCDDALVAPLFAKTNGASVRDATQRTPSSSSKTRRMNKKAASTKGVSTLSVGELPHFVPLLTPADACDAKMAAVQRAAAEGDWWAAEQAYKMQWALSDTTNMHQNTIRCVDAPYKATLRATIAALLVQGKAKQLASITGVATV